MRRLIEDMSALMALLETGEAIDMYRELRSLRNVPKPRGFKLFDHTYLIKSQPKQRAPKQPFKRVTRKMNM